MSRLGKIACLWTLALVCVTCPVTWLGAGGPKPIRTTDSSQANQIAKTSGDYLEALLPENGEECDACAEPQVNSIDQRGLSGTRSRKRPQSCVPDQLTSPVSLSLEMPDVLTNLGKLREADSLLAAAVEHIKTGRICAAWECQERIDQLVPGSPLQMRAMTTLENLLGTMEAEQTEEKDSATQGGPSGVGEYAPPDTVFPNPNYSTRPEQGGFFVSSGIIFYKPGLKLDYQGGFKAQSGWSNEPDLMTNLRKLCEADRLLDEASEHFKAGRIMEARQCYERINVLVPGSPLQIRAKAALEKNAHPCQASVEVAAVKETPDEVKTACPSGTGEYVPPDTIFPIPNYSTRPEYRLFVSCCSVNDLVKYETERTLNHVADVLTNLGNLRKVDCLLVEATQHIRAGRIIEAWECHEKINALVPGSPLQFRAKMAMEKFISPWVGDAEEAETEEQADDDSGKQLNLAPGVHEQVNGLLKAARLAAEQGRSRRAAELINEAAALLSKGDRTGTSFRMKPILPGEKPEVEFGGFMTGAKALNKATR